MVFNSLPLSLWRVLMKSENLIWAGFFLLMHSLFIALGVVVAFIVPSSGDASAHFAIDLSEVHNGPLSNEEYRSWLKFLDLPHEELIISRDNVAELLQSDTALANLDFFDGVSASARVEFLVSKLSANQNEETTCGVTVKVAGANFEDTLELMSGLSRVHQKKLEAIAESYTAPIEPNLMYLDCEESNPYGTDKVCTPEAGALLASILLVAVWSICTPMGQRTSPVSLSIWQLLVVTLAVAIASASIALVTDSWANVEWESQANVHLRRSPVRHLPASDITRELANELCSRIKTPDPFSEDLIEGCIDILIIKNGIMDWHAFKHIQENIDTDDISNGPPAEELLRDYILSRLVIQQDPEAPGIYTLRFRCGQRQDARSIISCLVDEYIRFFEAENETSNGRIANGSQLPRHMLYLDKLSLPSKPVKVRGALQPQIALQGAIKGAMCALILLSFMRVINGNPPV